MTKKILGLDLFSGYGGITLALKDYVQPIGYVEKDEYAQKIIASRISDGHLPNARIYSDVKNVTGRIGIADIIYGGFPCQDVSVAGIRRGLDGERTGLFFEIMRLAKEIEPNFIFLENVPGIRTSGLREIAETIDGAGYDMRWCILSANDVGAPHIRKRWFCLAKKRGHRQTSESNLADADRIRYETGKNRNDNCEGGTTEIAGKETERNKNEIERIFCREWWTHEPELGRVVNGAADRLDRIKALGNGVVPLQAKTAFEYLIGIKKWY